MPKRPGAAPSSRSKALTWPPVSRMTTERGLNPSSRPLARALRMIERARLSESSAIMASFISVLCRFCGFEFQPAAMQYGFGIARGLLAPLEDQIAGGLEGDSVKPGRHWVITWVVGVLPIHHLRHLLHRRHGLIFANDT